MATEVGKLVVEIEARVARLESGLRRGSRSVSRFGKRSRTTFGGVGRSFARLLRRFSGIGVAIGGLAATFGFAQFTRGAIRAASEVDGFTIRLQNLIGSQTEAADTLGRLQEKAEQVAPSLRDIIEAAATLGTVSLGSSAGIEALTDQAINIAAVTGLTLEQSSQNLQRALSAGIGAADLFRERGVRALLESITGIPNLVEAPLTAVAKAFEDVFGKTGEGGLFADAGEQFAKTLPGVISVTGDALFKLQAAFGEALSPVLIAGLQVIIANFGRLTKFIDANQAAVRDFARNGLIVATDLFHALGFVGITALRAFIGIFGLVRKAIFSVSSAMDGLLVGLASIGEQLGLLEAGTSAEIEKEAVAARTEFDEFETAATKLNEDLAVLRDELLPGIAKGTKAAFDPNNIKEVADASAEASSRLGELREAFGSQALRVDDRQRREAEAAEARLGKLIASNERARIKASDPIEAEIQSLRAEAAQIDELVAKSTIVLDAFRQQRDVLAEQRAALEVNAKTEEQREFLATRILNANKQITAEQNRVNERIGGPAAARRAQIAKQIADQEARRLRLQNRHAEITGIIQTATQTLLGLDAERVTEILNANTARILEAGTLEELTDAQEKLLADLVDGIQKAREELEDGFGDSIGAALSATISQALVDGALNGSLDFATIISDIAGQLLQATLQKALDEVGKSFNTLLDSLGKGSSKLGSAIGGGLGLGLALLSGAGGGDVTTSSAGIQSAVDSSQATRGVVAGPQQIAIAQVGNAIRDSFVETNGILAVGNDLLRQIRDRLAGGGAPLSAEEEAAALLGSTSPGIA